MGLVTRGADAALTTGVRSLRVAYDAAAAASTLLNGEWEALSAFGTKRYTRQALQVRTHELVLPWAAGSCPSV